MTRKILFGFFGAIFLSLIGLFVGINIGGNYFTGFQFMGGTGYEAVGYLGALIGAIVGVLLGVFLEIKCSNRRNK